MLLAEIALYEGDFGKASQQAEIAVELYPGNADNLIILAYYASETTRAEEALELMQRAFRLNPLPPPYYYSIRGIVLTSLNRFDEADEAFGHCLELAPEYVSCYRYRTVMHLEANDIEAAREAAREVLRVFPNYSISKHEFWHKQTTDPAERATPDRSFEIGGPTGIRARAARTDISLQQLALLHNVSWCRCLQAVGK